MGLMIISIFVFLLPAFIHMSSWDGGRYLATLPDITGTWVCADHQNWDGRTYYIYFEIRRNKNAVFGRIRYPWGERKITRADFEGNQFELYDQTGNVVFVGERFGAELHLVSKVGPQKGKPRIAKLTNNFHIPDPPFPLPLPALKKIPQTGEAPAPPMGWSSWNHFADRIDDKTIREIVDAMVRSGLRDAGYRYVNIDDTWEGVRDGKGEISANSKFPNMKALADYVHSKGLLLGIYSSPGPRTCAGYEGSFGHEEQDSKTFASWGIDLLKYDWCSAGLIYRSEDMRAVYQKMGEALASSGRKIVFNLCQYGQRDVGRWGKYVGGSLWRTGPDIENSWQSVSTIGFSQTKWTQFAGPGHWNDPDMLEIGNGALTLEEERTHMTLWSMLAAPLILGNDLRHITPETLSVLTNREIIAIDQDRLGKQGYRLYADGGIEVWKRNLINGDIAFAVFNRNDQNRQYTLSFAKIGLLEPQASFRDLWRQTLLHSSGGVMKLNVPAHGVVVFRVRATEKSSSATERE